MRLRCAVSRRCASASASGSSRLYALLPFPVDYVPYTGAHVWRQLQLLLFSGLAFFVMLPLLKRTLTITLDTDWLYRRLGPAVVKVVVTRRRRRRSRGAHRPSSPASMACAVWPAAVTDRSRGWRAPGRSVTMAIATLVMLLAYLALYYL